ncbi:hypothetical protein BH18ACT8_BH18ACT8_10650 [soil metagenome]
MGSNPLEVTLSHVNVGKGRPITVLPIRMPTAVTRGLGAALLARGRA